MAIGRAEVRSGQKAGDGGFMFAGRKSHDHMLFDARASQ